MLKGLNYDRNIVQFYGACIRQGYEPLLITEYMEGGPARPLYVWHGDGVYDFDLGAHGRDSAGDFPDLCRRRLVQRNPG